jgi:hypothetical protein
MKPLKILLLVLLVAFSAASAYADLADDLISYWTFDNADTSGTTAIDSTGTNNGTIDGATTGVAGKIAQAYDFDGATNYVNTNYAPANVNNGYTICLWFDSDDATISARQDIFGETGTNVADWRLSIETDEQAQVRIRDDTLSLTTLEGTTTVAGNGWHYICSTYNETSTTAHLYIDGSQQDSDAATLNSDFTPIWDFFIGARNDGGNDANNFDGTIDEVGIWNRALSPAEVTLLWNGGNGNPYSNWSGTPSNKFEITGFDANTATPINTFTANVTLPNGTTQQYSTTNGSITTTIDNADALIVNISAYATNYVPYTLNAYDSSADLAINFSTYWQLRAHDLYTGTALNTFSANITYQGVTNPYTTSTGLINTTIPINSSNLNITIAATNYYPVTLTNYYPNASLNQSLFQAQITFIGKEVVTNNTVNTFTATAPNAQTSTGTNPTLYLAAGSYNITFTTNTYYNYTEEFTVTALSNTTSTTSNFFRYYLAIRAQNPVNSTYDNNFAITGRSTNHPYNATATTTNSTAILKWNNETNVNLTLTNSSFLASTSILWNTSNYTGATPQIINITLQGLTTNSFFLTFYNETTDERLTTNVTVLIISPFFAVNYTTGTDAALNITFLTPSNYEIRYWYDADVPRSYYVTLTNQSAETIKLYTIDETTRALYIPVVSNQYGYPCADQTVSLLRYFVNNNAYAIVEMSKTDTNGNAVLNVQPNIINYKLQFSGNCGNFTTQPQKITGSTNSFTLNNAQSPLTILSAYDTISRSLTYINSTQTIVFNWADSSNIITNACLVVTKLKAGITTTVNNACSTSTSGSLIYTINDTNETYYTATSTITISTSETFSDRLDVSFKERFQEWGATGLFLTALIVILFATLGGGTPETTVILGTAAVLIMGTFGIIAFNWSYFVGMFIVVGIIIYKVTR